MPGMTSYDIVLRQLAYHHLHHDLRRLIQQLLTATRLTLLQLQRANVSASASGCDKYVNSSSSCCSRYGGLPNVL